MMMGPAPMMRIDFMSVRLGILTHISKNPGRLIMAVTRRGEDRRADH
jgi:hypothetical protein